jgi:hypothetical protein
MAVSGDLGLTEASHYDKVLAEEEPIIGKVVFQLRLRKLENGRVANRRAVYRRLKPHSSLIVQTPVFFVRGKQKSRL